MASLGALRCLCLGDLQIDPPHFEYAPLCQPTAAPLGLLQRGGATFGARPDGVAPRRDRLVCFVCVFLFCIQRAAALDATALARADQLRAARRAAHILCARTHTHTRSYAHTHTHAQTRTNLRTNSHTHTHARPARSAYRCTHALARTHKHTVEGACTQNRHKHGSHTLTSRRTRGHARALHRRHTSTAPPTQNTQARARTVEQVGWPGLHRWAGRACTGGLAGLAPVGLPGLHRWAGRACTGGLAGLAPVGWPGLHRWAGRACTACVSFATCFSAARRPPPHTRYGL
jgi:hypothetical protein